VKFSCSSWTQRYAVAVDESGDKLGHTECCDRGRSPIQAGVGYVASDSILISLVGAAVASRFRLKAANGEVAATGEAYETKSTARRGCVAVQRAAAATIVEVD
jgi:uncharacterized protein YegP (UPF0339 family)